ncbi:Glycosyl transferases group 1 [Rhodococcoides kroppenstedtii]|uniref:Glycosyl transferases group 1 n=1 Tax=Rhodococcoides kroppenstedtii TaxID=293050 RepID=A0A1I0TMW8_9NOCA|nr:glycosyltransferase [Rhodococcus kroppenstedtii]SFA53095.1 Glycosyl transferases group 1 [Rhodococcus kroppenstedtii]
MKATFLLPKDPSVESTGDLTMATLVMTLAAEKWDVQVVCLSSDPGSSRDGYTRVPKTMPPAPALLRDSLRSGRSLVHSRFVSRELIDAIDATETDIFVADHSYMAEAFLQSSHAHDRRDGESVLAVSTVVSESLVWRATRGILGKLDGRRIVRDELRVARHAYSVGTYDAEEAEFYSHHGIPRAHWLDLTLPPKKQVDLGNSRSRLVFLGDRKWPPNQQAYERLLRLWPDIARGIPGAELRIVGSPDPTRTVAPVDGVEDLGFVDDLDEFLSSCRAMIAPIVTGGGVRVKILDAASRGMPIVGTTAAIGSLGSVLGIDGIDDPAAFVAECRRYLLDRDAAVAEGERLHGRNAERWNTGAPHRTVHEWLAP